MNKLTKSEFFAHINQRPPYPYGMVPDAHYLADPLVEIDPETFWYFLEVLPPMEWREGRFCMCEFQDGDFTRQFAEIDGRFFSKLVRFRDRSTYITRELIEREVV